MRVVVREKINAIATPEIKTFTVVIEPITGRGKIPEGIGLMKGDVIVFRGEGDPVRFPSGNAAGKTLLTDPTSETGWVLGDPSEGSTAIATLHNATGEMILAGTVVKLSTGSNFVKAEAGDEDTLFIVSEDVSDDDDVDCYGITNSVCLVRCTSDAVSVGDALTVSSTDGLCESTSDPTKRQIAMALSAKASGSAGTVKAILIGVNAISITPVSQGGTGANTPSGARTNLGVRKIVYYSQQAVSTGTSVELFRITDDEITTNTIVLECTFASPLSITDNITWESFAGYISFSGSCSAATTANVTLAL